MVREFGRHDGLRDMGALASAIGTDTFLRKDGSFIDCDNEDAHRFFMRIFETSSFRFAELRSWLEEQVKPLPGALRRRPVRKVNAALGDFQYASV